MPPTDLDERLRRALSLAREPTASDEVMGSVVRALPERRARRRAIVGASGGAALGVLGLTIGLLVAGVGGPTPTTSARGVFSTRGPNRPSPATCMAVQVAAGAASCLGQITSAPSNDSNPESRGGSATAAQALPPGAGLDRPSATLHIAAGQQVVVFLARLPGVSWDLVESFVSNPSGSPSSAERSVRTHVDGASGRTEAVLGNPPATSFVLEATGMSSCATGNSCVPMIKRWSITVDVR